LLVRFPTASVRPPLFVELPWTELPRSSNFSFCVLCFFSALLPFCPLHAWVLALPETVTGRVNRVNLLVRSWVNQPVDEEEDRCTGRRSYTLWGVLGAKISESDWPHLFAVSPPINF
ncbi:unnamed protein product, partial [Pylaiella littoralis]